MKKKCFTYRAENQPVAWIYLLPALALIGLFNIYPIFKALWLSFRSGSLVKNQFNGIDNYVYVLKDTVFHHAMKNTAIYAFVVVPVCLMIALVIAWLIFEKVKNKSLFETIFFIPYVTSTIAIGIVFKALLNENYGLLNSFLNLFGIEKIKWLTSIQMSVSSMILFGIWNGLAFNIIILLAGLRNIPKNYYTVADMYGASNFEKFIRITLPQLFPTIAFLLTVNLIGAFKVYTQVYALFSGKAGIANSAQTAVFYIYDKFHMAGRPGYAMAATMILFVVILMITIIQNKLLKKGEQ